jgi:hypothetical protein
MHERDDIRHERLATYDVYRRPGPDAVTVERDAFVSAGERFGEDNAERQVCGTG